MSAEHNMTIVRCLMEEGISRGNLTIADEIIDPNFFDHTNPPGMQHGVPGHKAIVTLFRAGFPDLQWQIDDMLAYGDKVVIRTTMRGTQRGEFFGIPPTGKHVVVSGMHLLRLAGGKIVEHWGNNDDLGLMRQLGVIPSPEQAGA